MFTSMPALDLNSGTAHRIRGHLSVIATSLEVIRLTDSPATGENSILRAERHLAELRRLADEIQNGPDGDE